MQFESGVDGEELVIAFILGGLFGLIGYFLTPTLRNWVEGMLGE